MNKRITPVVFVLLAIIPVNIAAQTHRDTLSSPQEKTLRSALQNKSDNIFTSFKDYLKEHHVYVLDGAVITAEEYRAMSLSTLKHIRSITSKDDPVFKKYANDKTKVVKLLTKAKNFKESMLNIKVDPSKMVVMLVDGVDIPSSEVSATIDPNDIVRLEVLKDSILCGTFAPRAGGIVKVITRSKNFLNEIIDAEKERLRKDNPQTNLDTSKMTVCLIDGVEVRNVADYKLDLDDVLSIDVSKDKEVCNLFAPRTGGVIMITTRSKKLLGEIADDRRKHAMELDERAHRNGDIIIR